MCIRDRVKATGEKADSAWATSGEIPVVSASALVISGQDGDLGTLVNDVPYSVSSDTGNQISLELRVNGALWTALEVSSGYAQSIPVIDLPTGAGTIDILATVQASTGAVSAARAWTYTKTPVTTSAGPCDVVEWQDATGAVKFPVTLAEAVRIPGGDVYKRQPPRGLSAPPGPGPIPRHRSPPPRAPATWWSGRTPPARSSSPSPWRRRCASREG